MIDDQSCFNKFFQPKEVARYLSMYQVLINSVFEFQVTAVMCGK